MLLIYYTRLIICQCCGRNVRPRIPTYPSPSTSHFTLQLLIHRSIHSPVVQSPCNTHDCFHILDPGRSPFMGGALYRDFDIPYVRLCVYIYLGVNLHGNRCQIHVFIHMYLGVCVLHTLFIFLDWKMPRIYFQICHMYTGRTYTVNIDRQTNIRMII